MLLEKALKLLGKEGAEPGCDIQLNYRTDSGKKTGDFTLSGSFKSYKAGDSEGSALIMVSDEFCNHQGITLEDEGTLLFRLSDDSEGTLSRLYLDAGIREDQRIMTSHDNSGSPKLLTVIIICGVAFFIVFSGYLLIYNIMYISVTKNVRFYGRLKALGATARQIRKLVGSQAYRMALIGIPLGLLLGAVVSLFAVPKAIEIIGGNNISIMPSEISFNPVIYLGTVLFAVFTVMVSLRKPAKIAGAITPVEAMGYSGVSGKSKKSERKSTNGGKLYKMAFHNIFRDRKKALLVLASLFMGCITLLGMNVMLSSIDAEYLIEQNNKHSVTYHANKQMDRMLESPLDREFTGKISEIDGITNLETIESSYAQMDYDETIFDAVLRWEYKRNGYENSYTYDQYLGYIRETIKKYDKIIGSGKGYGAWIVGVDEAYIEEYNKSAENKIDPEAFRRGSQVLMAGWGDGSMDEMVGQELKLFYENHENRKTVKIAGIMDENNFARRYSHIAAMPARIITSKEFLEEFTGGEAIIDEITCDCSRSDEERITAELKELNATRVKTNFNFISRYDEKQKISSTLGTFHIFTDGISFVLLFIGALNFVNVMITGVNSRRKELATLESIGMTKKQTVKMLSLEGIYYAIITTVLLMTLGNAVLCAIAAGVKRVVDYAVFEYPGMLLLVLMIIVYAVCVTVPGIVYKAMSKETVVQRLRVTE